MFFINFVNLCNKKGISPSAAAEEMGYQRSVVTRWSKGTEPRQATLQRVADYFEVSVEELTKVEQKEKPTLQMESELKISDDDMKHLKQFHRADPATKEAIRLLLLKFSEEEQQ